MKTWLLLLACALVACPGVPRPLETPRADLRAVAVAEVSMSGLTLRFDLDVLNPNAVGLPLRAIDWELQLDDRPVARGRVDAVATIPAKGSAPVSTTATIGPGQAMAIVQAVQAGRATAYVRGTMHFETSLGDIAATFQGEHELRLP